MGRLALPLLCALLSACAAPDPARDRAPVPALAGRWGGAHAALLLSPSGGSIEYDCAHGTLDAPPAPDARGAFRVAGRHVPEHGGPERAGERLPSQPALYQGRVDGDRMRLQVQVGSDLLGPFLLRRDVDAQLLKCL